MQDKSENGALTSGAHISYWTDSVEPVEYGSVNNPISADVLVIGGGIAGLTTAYCLLQQGMGVVLVEDGLIGSGETGRTTAHITAALDDRYEAIEKAFGEEKSRLAAESHTAALEFIAQVVAQENIDCDLERVDGYLFLHPSDKMENLQKEYEATQRAGLPTTWQETMPGIRAEGPAICFAQQGQFHAMKYLKGLADAVVKMGGRIYTRTRAEKISEDGAMANGHKISAKHVVVATNTPVNDLMAIHTKQHPYRTYVIGCKVPKGALPHALWWDTGDMNSKWVSDPYHYVRLQNFDESYDLLIAGGEDHKTGQADAEDIPEEERYAKLTGWTREHFPMAGEVIYRWSGQVMEPVDYMAFIGKNPGNENIYIITGDSGNGITHGTIGGMLVTDLITGKQNPWEALYAPNRIPLKVPGHYLAEVFNMAKQYGDWLSSGDVAEAADVKPGEGAIVSHGLNKLAVYRTDAGELRVFSAVCPHLGCIVQWNADEKSFDCPCHGSRFTCEGDVVNGPATEGLKKG